MAGLKINVEEDGAVSVVTLEGVVDSATVSDFQQKLTPLFKKPPANVVLDCSALTYINSRAVGLLTHFHREAMRMMGRLVLAGLHNNLTKTLKIYRALNLFATAASVEEAGGLFAQS